MDRNPDSKQARLSDFKMVIGKPAWELPQKWCFLKSLYYQEFQTYTNADSGVTLPESPSQFQLRLTPGQSGFTCAPTHVPAPGLSSSKF